LKIRKVRFWNLFAPCVWVCACVCAYSSPEQLFNTFADLHETWYVPSFHLMPHQRRTSYVPRISNTNTSASQIVDVLTLIRVLFECLNRLLRYLVWKLHFQYRLSQMRPFSNTNLLFYWLNSTYILKCFSACRIKCANRSERKVGDYFFQEFFVLFVMVYFLNITVLLGSRLHIFEP
jgi:hypothetical protein